MTITIFSCRGSRNRLPCSVCSAPERFRCAFELKGKSEGKSCGRSLCERDAVEVDGKQYCPPHARALGART